MSKLETPNEITRRAIEEGRGMDGKQAGIEMEWHLFRDRFCRLYHHDGKCYRCVRDEQRRPCKPTRCPALKERHKSRAIWIMLEKRKRAKKWYPSDIVPFEKEKDAFYFLADYQSESPFQAGNPEYRLMKVYLP